MKLCDGDCTIKKKEIGNMSHSQAFSWTHMTKILGLILKKEKKENTHLREEGRAPGFFCKGKAQEQPPVSESLSCTALH